MPSQGNRYFAQGETVIMRAKVSKPGTKVPIDPDDIDVVTIIRRGTTEPIVTAAEFTRLNEGDYELAIATDDLELGTYDVTIRLLGPVSDTPRRAVLPTDYFILRAA